MKTIAKRLFRSSGFDIVRHPPHVSKNNRQRLLEELHIETIIDVGANVGQFVELVRYEGWDGKVVSFEPLPDAFDELQGKAESDNNWTAVNIALGDSSGQFEINVAKNSQASSFLELEPKLSSIDENLVTTNTVSVEVRRLDEFYEPEPFKQFGPCFLKLDVQGFEPKVIQGASGVLDQVAAIQCELSLEEMYKGEQGLLEMRQFLKSRGFVLRHLLEGWKSPSTGELLQVDGLFTRPHSN